MKTVLQVTALVMIVSCLSSPAWAASVPCNASPWNFAVDYARQLSGSTAPRAATVPDACGKTAWYLYTSTNYAGDAVKAYTALNVYSPYHFVDCNIKGWDLKTGELLQTCVVSGRSQNTYRPSVVINTLGGDVRFLDGTYPPVIHSGEVWLLPGGNSSISNKKYDAVVAWKNPLSAAGNFVVNASFEMAMPNQTSGVDAWVQRGTSGQLLTAHVSYLGVTTITQQFNGVAPGETIYLGVDPMVIDAVAQATRFNVTVTKVP